MVNGGVRPCFEKGNENTDLGESIKKAGGQGSTQLGCRLFQNSIVPSKSRDTMSDETQEPETHILETSKKKNMKILKL
jgi:hypothetical protein